MVSALVLTLAFLPWGFLQPTPIDVTHRQSLDTVDDCKGGEVTLTGAIRVVGELHREPSGALRLEATTSAAFVAVDPQSLDTYRLVVPPVKRGYGGSVGPDGTPLNDWVAGTAYHQYPDGHYDVVIVRTTVEGQETTIPVLLEVTHRLTRQGIVSMQIENVRTVC